MQKFQLLFENDKGGMLMPITVTSHSIVTVDGDKRVELNLDNGQTVQVPINDTMEAKINEAV
jgi:hypothetical protein